MFDEDEVAELVEMPYGDKRLFSLMTLLFPFVDVENNHFHIDHVFPRARFTPKKLSKVGVSEDDIEPFRGLMNLLPNLQLLEGTENTEKQAAMPATWIHDAFADDAARTNYCQNHLLGKVPDSITGFGDFYASRQAALQSKIIELLGVKRVEVK